MARDGADRLFVAANGTGQVWRVAGDPPRICTLLDGLPAFPDGPSAVATGSVRGPFPAENLYVVTFGGELIEVVDAAVPLTRPPDANRPRIRLSVDPRRTMVDRKRLFVFSASTRREGRRHALPGVRVRFGGELATTGRRGRTPLVETFAQPGRRWGRARRRGFRSAR